MASSARHPNALDHSLGHTFRLPADLTESLTALSRHERATLGTTLLAAFVALLFRYTGQEEPLHTSLASDQPFLALLRQMLARE